MRRRDLIAVLGSAAMARPRWAWAEDERMRHVGVLASHNTSAENLRAAFVETLAAHGWIEGRTVEFVYQWSGTDMDDLARLATNLVNLHPDVIFAPALSAWAVRKRTRTIPIVFTQIVNPVERGLVSSLAKPGGNVTGFADNDATFGGKWLELIEEVVPKFARAATLFDPDVAPHAPPYLRAIAAAARSFGAEAVAAPVKSEADIEAAVAALGADGVLLVLPDAFTASHRRAIIEAAARHRIPAIYPYRFFAVDGGLMAYAPDLVEEWRGAAGYVDRILRGANPADMPVQQPTKFELILNLKTAKALGLAIPPTLLARADEVIE